MAAEDDFESAETHLLRSIPRELTFQRFRLLVVQGQDRGLEKVSTSHELTIGTARSNDLVVQDPTVSRHHCRVVWTPQGVQVRDLGSANGMTLAGHRVESAYLNHGSVLGLGETLVRFESLEDQVREPLSLDRAFGRVLGESPRMRRLFAVMPRVAASEATVLLEGETGTGKGALADAIHRASPRRAGPFMVIDCSAIPTTLIETELFGHEKGAFTDARAAREGAFEAAAGGTVFLDEVGELPLAMQPKLLRALEDRVVQRVGGRTPVALDVRVIAATNRDLRQEVNRGTFRADLFYRLNIVRLELPPLRERTEDIPLLARSFFEQLAPPGVQPSPALLDAYRRQSWPGNVRELRNTIERDLVLGEGADGGHDDAAIAPVDGGHAESAAPFRVQKERAVAAWESAYLRHLLSVHGGNLSHAARAARMDRSYLRDLLRRHHIGARDEA